MMYDTNVPKVKQQEKQFGLSGAFLAVNYWIVVESLCFLIAALTSP